MMLGKEAGTLVLLRHGQSTANLAGTFTGVLDAALTTTGVGESHTAATLLNSAGLRPDVVFTSTLCRTMVTATVVLADLGSTVVPVADWRLNERNYGALTGLTKDDVRRRYGDEQFRRWRRSVDVAPPPMSDSLFHRLQSSSPFTDLPAQVLTRTENLRDVILRVRQFYDERVLPELSQGRTVFVVGHGNSLRALCAVLDGLSDAAVETLNIPTGHPLVYQFTAAHSPTPRGGRYLDPEPAHAASAALASQGGT